MTGITRNLDTAENADELATALEAAIDDPSVEVIVKSDELSAKHLLLRTGNIDV